MTLRISEIAVQMKVTEPGLSSSSLSSPGLASAGPQVPPGGPGAAGGLSPQDVEALVERCTAAVLARLRTAGER